MSIVNFSIIITCYNKSKSIDRAIRSAETQEIDSEIIIVDDFSRDGSQEVLRSYNHKTIFHEHNQGALQAYLSGIRAASGTYIILLDGDDELSPDALVEIQQSGYLDLNSCLRLGMVPRFPKYDFSQKKKLPNIVFRPGSLFAVLQNTGGTAYVFPRQLFEKCDAELNQDWPEICVQDHIIPGILALRANRFIRISSPCYVFDNSSCINKLSENKFQKDRDRLISDQFLVDFSQSNIKRRPFFSCAEKIFLKIALALRIKRMEKKYNLPRKNRLSVLDSQQHSAAVKTITEYLEMRLDGN